MAVNASYWTTTVEQTRVYVRINPDPNYAYYTIFVRLSSDTSDETYYQNHQVTEQGTVIEVTGLSPGTNYTINVGYNNTGGLRVDGWLGAQTFSTPALTNTVKIVYNANGGSGAPSSQTATSSSSSRIRVTLRTGEPTRSGYTFLGWSTSSAASAPTYYAGNSYYFDGSASGTTYTLYAVWSKNATYYAKIVYNADGGSGAPSSQTVSGSSSAVSVTLRTTRPTKTGFEFQGWSLSPGSDTPSYYPGETYTFPGSTGTTTTTLYAVWLKVEYIVRVEFVDDILGSTAVITSDSDPNVPVTMPDREDVPGLQFIGWADELNASEAKYLPGQTYDFTGTTSSKTYTLYAVYGLVYRVTLHFDANGGEDAPASQAFDSLESEISCTLPSDRPAKEGYTFAGWSYGGNKYEPGGTYTFTGSQTANVGTEYTLVAVWTQGVQVGTVSIGGRNYAPYVYTGGKWVKTTPRVFTGK